MFEFFGSIVEGGFDIVGNITNTIGSGLERFSSGFFPSPQRQTPITISQQAPVVNTGLSYRPTSPEPMSALETAAQAAVDWMDSPYEEQYGPSQPDIDIAGPPVPWDLPFRNTIEGLWGAATGVFSEISDQLPDILMRKWGVLPEAQVQNTAGDTIYQVYPDPNRSPDTTPADTAGQPRGTYDLGFLTDWLKLPAANIPAPTAAQVRQVAGISVQTLVLIGLVLLIFLVGKKL